MLDSQGGRLEVGLTAAAGVRLTGQDTHALGYNGTSPGPTLAHPFLLHVWPFTVLATSDATPPTGAPQDVVLIPARGWVRLRIPFTTYSGRSVYHCHILDHEDAGMMATVNVRT